MGGREKEAVGPEQGAVTRARGGAPARASETALPDLARSAGSRTDPAMVRALQRTVGNAAVARMLETEQHTHGPSCGHQPDQLAPAAAPVQRSSVVHDTLRASGRPLDASVRTEMEAGFGGANFGSVRIHDDAAAKESARAMGARAYTSGTDIVIGDGGGDLHTLAHELSHVEQQRRGPVPGTDHGDGLSVSDPGDRMELEAEKDAERVVPAARPSL